MLKKIYRNYRRTYEKVLSPVFSKDLDALAIIHKTDKWNKHWYTQHYDTHFRRMRTRKLNILEIGVGGYDSPHRGADSLRMWKKYFPKSNIFAIDIYDKSKLQEDRIKIYQGSQVDEEFLAKVYKEVGKFDIIIDDGSHINEHVIKTFEFLFPLLEDGGIYVAEDVQTSYWEEYGGDSKDLKNPKTMMNYFKSLTDCLNHEEIYNPDYKPTYFDKHIVSMHFYHNMVFIYKGKNDEGSNFVTNNSVMRNSKAKK
jgi:hypothetical protein